VECSPYAVLSSGKGEKGGSATEERKKLLEVKYEEKGGEAVGETGQRFS